MTTTIPGGLRQGNWHAFEGGAVRVDIIRGYDCRNVCEHVPPLPNEGGKNHGQHGDEFRFAFRTETSAIELICYSWIRNGAIQDFGSIVETTVYGAWLNTHHAHPGSTKRTNCHLLPQGCEVDSWFSSIAAREMFLPFAELVESFVVRKVDEIDVNSLRDALRPLWLELKTKLD